MGLFLSEATFLLLMFLRQKCQRQWHTTDIIVLALATLGDAMQIEMILSVSYAANIFAYKTSPMYTSLYEENEVLLNMPLGPILKTFYRRNYFPTLVI
jgi:hypothetical protein